MGYLAFRQMRYVNPNVNVEIFIENRNMHSIPQSGKLLEDFERKKNERVCLFQEEKISYTCNNTVITSQLPFNDFKLVLTEKQHQHQTGIFFHQLKMHRNYILTYQISDLGEFCPSILDKSKPRSIEHLPFFSSPGIFTYPKAPSLERLLFRKIPN
ncbi:hypothetical protein CEXT_504811 [Caerostris extrusa]|uniref:Ribosomal protein/NADH dehydrogenase domain-containing protein n=1 Tax=Caerostris extrusa TaxID=172846 RepID=A0AAV4TY69_CAEEX|nr:hypothetical protein CEXT_504811 [Caerostris extrusa]